MLVPVVEGAAPDIRHYRGRVTRIEPLHAPILGQAAWQLRVAVGEFDNGREIEIGLLATALALGDARPPEPGTFIEGALWLQGSFWRRMSWAKP